MLAGRGLEPRKGWYVALTSMNVDHLANLRSCWGERV